MNPDGDNGERSPWRTRLWLAGFWAALVSVLWTLDTLTQLALRERTGLGLDDFRLFAEQATSAAGVLAMVAFVGWWLNHFPIRFDARFRTMSSMILGHVIGSIAFSLGHYSVMILLRRLLYPAFGREYGSPASLLSNLVFEYQKDIKIYLGIVVIITIYRMFLGGENRLRVRPRADRRILVQTGSGQAVLSYAQIDFLESARNYVVVHANGREYLVRNTMSALLDTLADGNIVRSHRSFAVNLDRVEEIRGTDSGLVVRIRGGREIPLSRSYRDRFRAALAGEVPGENGT